MAIDYKHKYKEILQKFVTATDTMYRLGFEKGAKEAKMNFMAEQAQQAQMQAQQMQQQMQAQQMGGGGAMPSPEELEAQGAPPEVVQQAAEAQAMQQAGGAEMPPMGMEGMMGGDVPMEEGQSTELDSKISELEGLLAKGEKPSYVQLRKVVNEINDLRKSKKKNEGKVVEAQRSVVENIMKKWENESKDLNKNIEDLIKEKGIDI